MISSVSIKSLGNQGHRHHLHDTIKDQQAPNKCTTDMAASCSSVQPPRTKAQPGVAPFLLPGMLTATMLSISPQALASHCFYTKYPPPLPSKSSQQVSVTCFCQRKTEQRSASVSSAFCSSVSTDAPLNMVDVLFTAVSIFLLLSRSF